MENKFRASRYGLDGKLIDFGKEEPKHPWTNGQVERMNRTINDAYNFARRLKTLRGLTPYEFICKAWASQPQRFKLSPLQQMPGLNI